MDLDHWEQADAALDRAVALAPRDDRVLTAAALICSAIRPLRPRPELV